MPTFGTAADDEVVSLHEQFYIQATSSRADDRTRVLKHDETFAVFDRFGDVQPVGLGEQGIYHDGTRFLSRLELRLGGRRPLLLSSTVKKENDLLTVDLATPDLKDESGQLVLPRGTLHVFRTKFLWRSCCYERLRISNYATTAVDVELAVSFSADFVDIFEVRGSKRERRGTRREPVVERGRVALEYEGLDGVVRRTRLAFDPAPDELSGGHALYHLRLASRGTSTIYLKLSCDDGGECGELDYDRGCSAVSAAAAAGQLSRCRVRAPGSELDEWIARSVSDLEMMITATPHGPYPYAGVPWYSTPFGRDGIITALEVLWVAPDIARGVLSYLSATQATDVELVRDAEPGKILHEARGGEMAALGEVPFGRYYGSVDATPLYVILAAAYHRRTGDTAFLRTIAPAVQRALDWIERYGDIDGDGFVEYARKSPTGLSNQGWKDSSDSVFHEDGALAEGPIALCEVQAYVFGAWHAAAEIVAALGAGSGEGEAAAAARVDDYRRKAAAMRARFEAAFWDEALGTYVLALDGHKRPCRVASSNAGHALWTGIVGDPARARRVADGLMGPDSFSGWGIRTIPSSQARYNPMSYHNGSVWPHDNAMIAAGFARYGFRDLVNRLLDAMKEASLAVDQRRLPELICGFPRRPGEGPTQYPVACAPQAWAAGAVFMLLSAGLGLTVDGCANEITLSRPGLPAAIPMLRVIGLPVDGGSIDLLVENHPHDLGVTVLRRDDGVRVIVVK
jgi:glycogen debranching enzyme